MGCCCSSETESSNQDSGSDERTRLLPDSPLPSEEQTNGYEVGDKNYGATTEKIEGKPCHTKILHKAAGKLIAIGAPECQPPLADQEYGDRIKNYERKLKQVIIPESLVNQYCNSSLLADVPFVDKILNDEPISAIDYHFMKGATDKIGESLRCINVDCDETVTVSFG